MARAEILTKSPLFFWEIWRHQFEGHFEINWTSGRYSTYDTKWYEILFVILEDTNGATATNEEADPLDLEVAETGKGSE